MRFAPGRGLLIALSIGWALALALLIVGVSVRTTALLAVLGCGVLLIAAIADRQRTLTAWRAADVKLYRRLPAAFALAVPTRIGLDIQVGGPLRWRARLFDHADPTLALEHMPLDVELRGGTVQSLDYRVTPTRRGELRFAPADAHVRSQFGLLTMMVRIGEEQSRRCFPDFAQIARYAWLAGDRRLAEIGIKTYRQRGEGTDFKQLADYQIGDPLRHMDWKATLRYDRPIVRQFQNERDQSVILLIDCGRRMRADDRNASLGTSHFDQVLNAALLLSYVALRQGDAVGAMTFGTAAGDERWAAPRKGLHALNALMGQLYSVQPSTAHSDLLLAAQDLLRRHRKRSLVILITNFRDEDSSETTQALRLLRTRHLVMTASLRERVVNALIDQPVSTFDAAIDVSSAHLYEQARRDAFTRMAAAESLVVDAEPQRLGVELVNRYHAVKKAGLI
jgi:uncharacterized protein (DUF58 family)